MDPKEKKPLFKREELVTFAAVILAIVLAVVSIADIYWNSVLDQLGDPEATVPTLSYEEQQALLGTAEPVETSPEETWLKVEPRANITNIMLVGQNYREDEQNKLSDTMILCSINRETNTMTMVSFLRDLFVPLPAYAGHGPGGNRINVCYALGSTWKRSSLGGMEMLALCVEQNFGIHVDHTIEVSFDSFTTIIDALGGVELYVSPEEAEYMTSSVGYVGEITSGWQTLNGNQTLAYARIRAIDGDMQRTARQRRVINALVQKCRDRSLLELSQMVYDVLPMVITDMSNEDITHYFWELLPMIRDIEIRSMTCPVDNETLPGSMWGEVIELYGYQSSIIRCNISQNRAYLLEALGLENS